MKVRLILQRTLIVLVSVLLLTQSVFLPKDLTDRVRQYTGGIEFDYVKWTLDSLALKVGISGVDPVDHLTPDTQKRIVTEYFNLVSQYFTLEYKIETIFLILQSKIQRRQPRLELGQQADLQKLLDRLAPIAEVSFNLK
jgi:hypothetical protein